MSRSKRDRVEAVWLEVSATVAGTDGLHARPAILFSRAAKLYAARVQIRESDGASWVDAKSVAKVMALQVEGGRTIHLRAAGADAAEALGKLRELVEVDLAGEDQELE